MADYSKYKYYKGEKENPYKCIINDVVHSNINTAFDALRGFMWIIEKNYAKGNVEGEKFKDRIFSRWFGTPYKVKGHHVLRVYDEKRKYEDCIDLDETLKQGKLVVLEAYGCASD
jgi:hypothetical protein